MHVMALGCLIALISNCVVHCGLTEGHSVALGCTSKWYVQFLMK